MMKHDTQTGLELRSLITARGKLELSLVKVPVPQPAGDQVVVRVEAAPINPSDLGLLFGAADMRTAQASRADTGPAVTADVPAAAMRAMSGRLDQSLAVGNEGAGVVVKAGASPAAQAILGKSVALLVGGMYAQYRVVKAADCLPLPDAVTPAKGASCFVNPLTALCMVETMRREGHRALVHSAAASNLGQMLNRICLEDQVPLVNIVRRAEQAEILRALGAQFVCDSSAPDFMDVLIAALKATGATLAFDAVGGGKLASQILTGMEAAALANSTRYSGYGSTVHKQVYIYGGLDTGPIVLNRSFGMAWGVGGWLLTAVLKQGGSELRDRLHRRIAADLKTTFASHYARTISLAEALELDTIAVYGKCATGEKYLIDPRLDARVPAPAQ